MADYTIISDVSFNIVKTLRQKMCPEPIPSPNNIEVTSPASQDVDYILGLYLYDIAFEGEISRPTLMQGQGLRLKKPPKPYALYYMLFINGSSQMGLKAFDIQKIIGRAAQVLSDGNVFMPNTLQNWLEMVEPPIILSPDNRSFDDKTKVWSSISKPYQVSLFYKCAPVFLSSEVIIDPPRVRDAAFNLAVTGEKI